MSNWGSISFSVPRDFIEEPLVQLDGAFRQFFDTKSEIELALSPEVDVGTRLVGIGKMMQFITDYEPKPVEHSTAFALMGRLSESYVDVSRGLSNLIGSFAPFLPEDAAEAVRQQQRETSFDLSLFHRTAAPFRECGATLTAPQDQCDRLNRNIVWGAAFNTIFSMMEAVREALAGKEAFSLPYHSKFYGRLDLTCFMEIAQNSRHLLETGFSSIHEGAGVIRVFPSFYYRQPYFFSDLFSIRERSLESVGDVALQEGAARGAWKAMARELDAAPLNFYGLASSLEKMPGLMLGSYWSDLIGLAASDQMNRAADRLLRLYECLPENADESFPRPTKEAGQLDWSTYRLAHEFEHIALSLKEVGVRDGSVQEEKVIRCFLETAKAYGDGLVSRTGALGLEAKKQEDAFKAYETLPFWRKCFTAQPEKPKPVRLLFGPAHFLSTPYAAQRPQFLSAADGLFTASGRGSPWAVQAK